MAYRKSSHLSKKNLQTEQDSDRLLAETLNALTVVESQAIRLALLNEMITEFNMALNFEGIYRVIANKVPLLVDSDWVSMALINETGQFELLLLDDQPGKVVTIQPLPDNQTIIHQAVQENRVVVVSDLEISSSMTDIDLFETDEFRSAAVVPLVIRGQAIGTLNVGRGDPDVYDVSDESFMMQVASMIASTFDNRRLFAKTQTMVESLAKRATELETLLSVSTATAILDREEMLPAVVELTKKIFDLYHVHIYLYNEAKQRLDMVAGDDEPSSHYSSSWSIPLNHPNSLVAEVARRHEGVVVGDVSPATDFSQNPLLPRTRSEMVVPMIVGQHLLGVLDLQAEVVDYFTAEDLRLQTAIAAQVAVALQNANLYQQAQHRADQLQWLATIEATLSQATDEAEILTAVTFTLDLDAIDFSVWLYYIDADHQDTPLTIQLVMRWHDGLSQPDHPLVGRYWPVEEWMLGDIILSQPSGDILFMNDISTDERLADAGREHLQAQNIHALAAIPLRSGNFWQGLILFSWPEIHTFSNDERFYMQRMIEPLAAVIARRRANLQQQETLRVTRKLYQAGRQLNEATNLTQIVELVVSVGPMPAVQRAVILIFDQDTKSATGASEFGDNLARPLPSGHADRDVGAPGRHLRHESEIHPSATPSMVVAVNWPAEADPPIGRRYPQQIWPNNDLLFRQDPTFCLNVQPTEWQEIHSEAAPPLVDQTIRTMVVLPLWVGNRQLGVLLLQTTESCQFSEQEQQFYLSLAPQVAVAIENRRLLERTQAQVRREQILRRVTAQVRSVTDVETVMRTAVQEVGQAMGCKTFVHLE